MDYFLQQLVNGISLGAIYGLIAIGYTMVYGIIGMINFAHGDIYMIGAFVSLIGFLLMNVLGITYVPLAILCVLVLAMAFTAVYGWALERLAYRPLRGAPRLAPLISAIGASIVLQNFVQISQGARVKPLQPIFPGTFSVSTGGNFDITISYLQVVIVTLTIVLNGRVHVSNSSFFAWARPARDRARPHDGVFAWRQRRPDDIGDLCHGRVAGSSRGPHGDALLRSYRFLYRLPRGH